MGGTESVPENTVEPQKKNIERRRHKTNNNIKHNQKHVKQDKKLSAYEILSLPKDCSIKQLQKQYKALAQIYHPDKGGSSKVFNMITKAYKKVYFEKKQQVSNKIEEPVINKEYTPPEKKTENIYLDKDKFDSAKFNKVFTDYRINNPYDKGYGEVMEKSSKTREDIGIERMTSLTSGNFNSRFMDQNCTEVVVHKEPEPLYSNNFNGIMELGLKEINDFSGNNYTDYQMAYNNKFYNPNNFKRKEYSNMREYENARARQNMEMTAEEKEYMDMMNEAKRQKEEERQKQVRMNDEVYERRFMELNKIMIRR